MSFSKIKIKDEKDEIKMMLTADLCPYCKSKDIVKSGKRKNKYGEIQLYLCGKCEKRFTPLLIKHKTFPLRLILSAVTLYNHLYTFEDSARLVSEKYGIKISGQNVRNWIKDFKDYLPFLRMREFIEKKFKRKDMIESVHMMHGQIYDFKYHRAKMHLLLEEDFKHFNFKSLREFLDLVSAECPHQVFRESKLRASEFKDVFNLDQVRIIPKVNAAVRSARIALQAVDDNKLRHKILQEFMLANDSVTVAVEVPVILDADDVRHFRDRLGFDVPLQFSENDVITGHIDFIQVRNGSIYILDYKPSAEKAKPAAQLILYALALSRLTGLRLYHFKCAWFDDNIYYEFFPLHVVYKKKSEKKKKLK